MAADATGDTDGAARPGHQAQADLWKRYSRFGVGDDVVCEGSQFDTDLLLPYSLGRPTRNTDGFSLCMICIIRW